MGNYCEGDRYFKYKPTPQNGVLIMAVHQRGGYNPSCNNGSIFLKTILLDKRGNLTNQEAYEIRQTNYFYPHLTNIISRPNSGYLVGIDNQLIELDSLGKIQRNVKYKNNSHFPEMTQIKLGKNNQELFALNRKPAHNIPSWFYKINLQNYKVEWIKSNHLWGARIGVMPNGQIAYLANKTNNGIGGDFILANFNTKGEYLWGKQYAAYFIDANDASAYEQGNKFTTTKDSGFLIPALKKPNHESYLIKTDKKGNVGCAGRPYQPKIDTPQLPKRSFINYQPISRPVTVKNAKIESYPAQAKETFLCSKNLFPKAHLGPDTLICYDSSLTLDPGPDTSAFQYQWNTGETTSTITVDSGGVYAVEVSYKGCTARDSIRVNFLYENPGNLRSDTLLCKADSLHLRLPAYSGQWLWQTPDVDTFSNADTIRQLDQWVSDTGIYRLFVDSITRCPLDTFQIKPVETPDLNLENQRTICPYDSVLLTPDTTGVSVKWKLPDTNQSIQNQNQIWAQDTGQYNLLDSTYGCCITRIDVKHYPLPEAKTGPDTTLCYNQPYTMQGEGGISYKWIPAKYLSSDTIPDPKAKLPNRQVYNLIVNNEQGCSDTSRVVLNVRPPLSINLTGNKSVICEGERIRLRAQPKGGMPSRYRYDWEDFKPNQKVRKVKIREDRMFRFQLRDYCSEPAADSFFVQVKSAPVADFQMRPPDTVYLKNTVKFENLSKKATDYKWHFGPANQTSNKAFPEHTYQKSGAFNVRLVASRKNQCMDTVEKSIFVRDDYRLFIPNAFSPDGNGVNDQWSIRGLGLKAYQIHIYNRWGAKIYSSDLNKEINWDGTYPNSNEVVPAGTYLYKVKVLDKAGRVHFQTGELTLVK